MAQDGLLLFYFIWNGELSSVVNQTERPHFARMNPGRRGCQAGAGFHGPVCTKKLAN